MGNKNDSKKLDNIKQEGNFDDIKSKYILKKIFYYLNKKKSLKIVKKSAKMKTRLDININDYKENTIIEIEIIPIKNKYGKFINNLNKEEESYFHIYFNNDENEKFGKYNIYENEQFNKIKVIIDCKIKSFHKLFNKCDCIESISFKRFYKDNLTDMSYMFSNCSSLKIINFYKYIINNVSNMSHMFHQCRSLNKLDLSNFNTENVTDMSSMFANCESLKKLDLSNFNTKNVEDMKNMFSCCFEITNLLVNNFNTDKVTNMSYMFANCGQLKKLNISSFNIKKETNTSGMFYFCSKILKDKMKDLYNIYEDDGFSFL